MRPLIRRVIWHDQELQRAPHGNAMTIVGGHMAEDLSHEQLEGCHRHATHTGHVIPPTA